MKVLVVAPQPFFTPRGTPFSVYYRTLVVAEQGASIDLLTYGAGADIDVPNVRTVRVPRIRSLEPVPTGPSWNKLVLDVLMVLWTMGLLVRYRYPVVHAHEEAVFWCRFLKPLFRFKLVYDMHSSLPEQLENFGFTKSKALIGTFAALERSALAAADAVITICPALQDAALKSGVDPQRHFLIENSIFEDVRLKAPNPVRAGVQSEAEEVSLDAQGRYVLYAGTFEAYQGIDLLLDAFALVAATHPSVTLVMVGGVGEQLQRARARTDALGLSARVRLAGRVPKSAVLRLTQSATVLVSPRLHGNNTPLKVYEQLASGRPLVATRVYSHTQVLDDEMCYLADPTPESMADALRKALNDPVDSARRVSNALERYRDRYSRPVYEDKIRRLLERLA